MGDILWPLANILWRIYASVRPARRSRLASRAESKRRSQRKLHTQSTELQKSLSAMTPPEEKRLSSRASFVRQTDVCQSFYWRGRLGVVLLDMRNARYWLEKSWGICPDVWQQRRCVAVLPPSDHATDAGSRAILIRLIPVNLLLGRLPSMSLLQQYNLPEFLPLILAFRTGNVPAWRRILDESREWYRRRSIWLLLFERGEILVWRNLFRQT